MWSLYIFLACLVYFLVGKSDLVEKIRESETKACSSYGLNKDPRLRILAVLLDEKNKKKEFNGYFNSSVTLPRVKVRRAKGRESESGEGKIHNPL